MMMLTMKAPETPAATTDHDRVAAERVCAESDMSTIRSASDSCGSLTSSCSNSTSSTLPPNMLKVKKRVSFSLKQTAYFSPEQQLSREERKSECWYSESELNVSRDEARTAIQAMQHQLQLDAAAATAQATTSSIIEPVTSAAPLANELGSWILRCPEDETKIVCLRGIEKYADAAAKYAGQKRLVHSVLQQQSLNNEDIHVALVSQTLSKPFKEVARYYAMKSAEELVLSRKHEAEQEETERKQREEVATVLLLIMGQENNQKQQEASKPLCKTPSQPPNPKLQESSPVVTPRGSLSGKRSFTNSPLCESRNVKPCVRRISE